MPRNKKIFLIAATIFTLVMIALAVEMCSHTKMRRFGKKQVAQVGVR